MGCRACGEAPLTIVHAIGGKPTGSEYLQATGERSAERTRLMDVAERLRAMHPDLRVETETLHGSAIDALGERLAADALVVVGGPDHRRTTRWTLGSRLAGRRGGGPVAVIPATSATERRVAVVAGVDGSQAALAAVEVAAPKRSASVRHWRSCMRGRYPPMGHRVRRVRFRRRHPRADPPRPPRRGGRVRTWLGCDADGSSRAGRGLRCAQERSVSASVCSSSRVTDREASPGSSSARSATISSSSRRAGADRRAIRLTP